MVPLHPRSVAVVILLNYTCISVLLLSGTTLAKRPIITFRTDSAAELNTIHFRRSSPIIVLQGSELTGKERGFARRLLGPVPPYLSSRIFGSSGREVERFREENVQRGIHLNSAFRSVRDMVFGKDSTVDNNPVPLQNFSHLEMLKSVNDGVRHDVSRRALLRDISPPGMWPITDDQDKEYVRRRILLTSNSPAAVSGR